MLEARELARVFGDVLLTRAMPVYPLMQLLSSLLDTVRDIYAALSSFPTLVMDAEVVSNASAVSPLLPCEDWSH